MFGNGSQNNQNAVNVNTKIYSSFSDTAALTLSLWNDKLSIKLSPLKGVNQDGLRQYAFDNKDSIITSLVADNALALIKGIKDKIYPAIEKKEEATVSTIVNADNATTKKILTVSTKDGDVFFTIYVNINADNSVSEGNSLSHKFNKRDIILSYNSETGQGETVQTNSDFDSFVKRLGDVASSAAESHFAKYNAELKNQYANRSGGGYGGSTPAQNYSAPINNYGSGELNNLPF